MANRKYVDRYIKEFEGKITEQKLRQRLDECIQLLAADPKNADAAAQLELIDGEVLQYQRYAACFQPPSPTLGLEAMGILWTITTDEPLVFQPRQYQMGSKTSWNRGLQGINLQPNPDGYRCLHGRAQEDEEQ